VLCYLKCGFWSVLLFHLFGHVAALLVGPAGSGHAQEVVQQMSTVARAIPGSVGERKDMRQKLESVVDQIETESADTGENGGRGRLPAGFCTFTCAIYKWQQLFELIMRSPSVSQRAEYLQWQTLGPVRSKKRLGEAPSLAQRCAAQVL